MPPGHASTLISYQRNYIPGGSYSCAGLPEEERAPLKKIIVDSKSENLIKAAANCKANDWFYHGKSDAIY